MDSKLIKKTKQAAAARAEVSISSAYSIVGPFVKTQNQTL